MANTLFKITLLSCFYKRPLIKTINVGLWSWFTNDSLLAWSLSKIPWNSNHVQYKPIRE